MKTINIIYILAALFAVIIFLIYFIKPSLIKSIGFVKYLKIAPIIIAILAVIISIFSVIKYSSKRKLNEIKSISISDSNSYSTVGNDIKIKKQGLSNNRNNLNFDKSQVISNNPILLKLKEEYNSFLRNHLDSVIFNHGGNDIKSIKYKLELIHQEIVKFDSKAINVGLSSVDSEIIANLLDELYKTKEQYNNIKKFYDQKYWYPIINTNNEKKYALKYLENIKKIDSSIQVKIYLRQQKDRVLYVITLGVSTSLEDADNKLNLAISKNITKDGYSYGSNDLWTEYTLK
jgi:hypothetical protein